MLSSLLLKGFSGVKIAQILSRGSFATIWPKPQNIQRGGASKLRNAVFLIKCLLPC